MVMHNKMKEALSSALNEILSLTPEQLIEEVDKIDSGEVYDFFMESGKFSEENINSKG